LRRLRRLLRPRSGGLVTGQGVGVFLGKAAGFFTEFMVETHQPGFSCSCIITCIWISIEDLNQQKKYVIFSLDLSLFIDVHRGF
jgi:hypothetical protein